MTQVIPAQLDVRQPPLGMLAQRSPAFPLFVAANGALFIRPSELIEMQDQRLYLVVIAACLAFSLLALRRRLTWATLQAEPITTCLIGFWAAITISSAWNGDSSEALVWAWDFGKVVLYYLLLTTLVNSPQRLRSFLFWIGLFVLAIAAFAVARYHDLISAGVPGPLVETHFDAQQGTYIDTLRLQTTGIFRDPNDMCLMLLLGVGFAAYRLQRRSSILAKGFWLASAGVLLYAIALTQSRGGFLALLVGAFVFLRARFGGGKWLLVAPLALGLLAVAFGGRQTHISAEETTGQQRLEAWRDGLVLMREKPLLGIGPDRFRQRVGLVAHNSYIHCFTELGAVGGCCFFGAFLFGLWNLHRIGEPSGRIVDPECARLRPYLLASAGAYAAGLMLLSNSYTVPTWMVLGLTTVFLRVTPAQPPLQGRTVSVRLAAWTAGASVAFLLAMTVAVRVFFRAV